eukprot:SAG11_NODE_1114_length_5808_cov_12.177965_4_plen_211_part_00
MCLFFKCRYFEYGDLGIAEATNGRFKAHVIRVKGEEGGHGAGQITMGEPTTAHTTGVHTHGVDFQMNFVLRGWMKFVSVRTVVGFFDRKSSIEKSCKFERFKHHFRLHICQKLLSVVCQDTLKGQMRAQRVALQEFHVEGVESSAPPQVNTFHAGDCWLQPPGIVHNELACSDDLLNVEITSPATFATEKLDVALAEKAMAKVLATAQNM